MTDDERAKVKELVELAHLWYGYYDSEFRISSDPPNKDYERLVEIEKELLGEGVEQRVVSE